MLRSFFLSLLLVALTCAIPGPPARACGGFFCSSPTQPIAQAGEKIVFALDADGSITAVVQITYSGPASSFAWILPVPSVPTVSVGTTALVQGLDAATTPTYPLAYQTEGSCYSPPCTPYVPPYAYLDASLATDAATAADAGGVTIAARAEVGPYDYVILSGSTSTAIHDWLVTNGYLVPATTTPLLDPYVATGSQFIAVKLSRDASPGQLPSPVGNLAPLVLHYTSGEPCIPLRLTAVAALPDMPITAFFLAAADVVPTNYLETELPDDPSLWTSPGAYYYDIALSRAADDAGGKAWVREFTGVVPAITIATPDLTSLATVTDPKDFVRGVLAAGLPLDQQLIAILADALPPPSGASAAGFISCLSTGCPTYDAYLSGLSFDAAATEMRIDAEVIGPRHEANVMLHAHTRLTRLGTTMSADEMTVDPTFGPSATHHDVTNVHPATMVTECSALYLPGAAPTVLRQQNGDERTIYAGSRYPGDATYCARPDAGHTVPPPVGARGCCAIARPSPPTGLALLAALGCAATWRTRRRDAR